MGFRVSAPIFLPKQLEVWLVAGWMEGGLQDSIANLTKTGMSEWLFVSSVRATHLGFFQSPAVWFGRVGWMRAVGAGTCIPPPFPHRLTSWQRAVGPSAVAGATHRVLDCCWLSVISQPDDDGACPVQAEPAHSQLFHVACLIYYFCCCCFGQCLVQRRYGTQTSLSWQSHSALHLPCGIRSFKGRRTGYPWLKCVDLQYVSVSQTETEQ